MRNRNPTNTAAAPNTDAGAGVPDRTGPNNCAGRDAPGGLGNAKYPGVQ